MLHSEKWAGVPIYLLAMPDHPASPHSYPRISSQLISIATRTRLEIMDMGITSRVGLGIKTSPGL